MDPINPREKLAVFYSILVAPPGLEPGSKV